MYITSSKLRFNRVQYWYFKTIKEFREYTVYHWLIFDLLTLERGGAIPPDSGYISMLAFFFIASSWSLI